MLPERRGLITCFPPRPLPLLSPLSPHPRHTSQTNRRSGNPGGGGAVGSAETTNMASTTITARTMNMRGVHHHLQCGWVRLRRPCPSVEGPSRLESNLRRVEKCATDPGSAGRAEEATTELPMPPSQPLMGIGPCLQRMTPEMLVRVLWVLRVPTAIMLATTPTMHTSSKRRRRCRASRPSPPRSLHHPPPLRPAQPRRQTPSIGRTSTASHACDWGSCHR